MWFFFTVKFMELTQDRLKELFNYDPDTGIFICKTRRANRTKIGDVAGSIKKSGYVCINIQLKSYLAHRLAFLYILGAIPDYVDHINGDKTDNRFLNLRPCTSYENNYNVSLRVTNTSGVKGVCYDKYNNDFHAYIYTNANKRVQKHFSIHKLGIEEALKQAQQWVKNKRIELHGEFANHG